MISRQDSNNRITLTRLSTMDIFQESPNHFNNKTQSIKMINQLMLKMTLNRVTVNGDFDIYYTNCNT